MNREMAVNLYNIIVQLRPEWHSDKDNDCFIKVLITGSIMDSDRMRCVMLKGVAFWSTIWKAW